MSNQPKIVTHTDGSINIAHYMARGRQLRSAEAHKQLKAVENARRSALASLYGWLSAKFEAGAKRVTA